MFVETSNMKKCNVTLIKLALKIQVVKDNETIQRVTVLAFKLDLPRKEELKINP